MAYQITLADPCTQKGTGMTATEGGWHCAHCNTLVIDMTRWTDVQIFEYYRLQNGKACGRFRADQLERKLIIPQKNQSRLYRMAMALGLSIIASGSLMAKTMPRAPLKYENEFSKSGNDEAPKTDSTAVIKGTVFINVDQKSENVALNLLKNGRLVMTTKSDHDGFFEFANLPAGNYVVSLEDPGFKSPSKQVSIEKGQTVQISLDMQSAPPLLKMEDAPLMIKEGGALLMPRLMEIGSTNNANK